MRPASTSTLRAPSGTDKTSPACPSALGGVNPGISACGSTAVGEPSAAIAGDHPEPSTTATSWEPMPVRSAMTSAAWAASSLVTLGETTCSGTGARRM